MHKHLKSNPYPDYTVVTLQWLIKNITNKMAMVALISLTRI
jgi:hypothetical protein